ncbi:hypothetical protein [Ruania halotolerans]|uniref:hypothetical protein n=1 Tax=Ruania halotolerans TaxID=2897773 RepID=UPI001E29ABDF|nr:hypothetical protein [Ruania halotolerans]UFU06353.1 hypothetical protein LQF10_18325 [Ruania halotolerans]
MKKSVAGALTTTALIVSTALLTAAPASAALTTRCVGEGGAVTVPGDLVVPAGQACVLTGTTVTGDVRVAPGADLIADQVTVEGRIVGAADAYVELVDSSVAGELVLRDAFGGLVEDSAVQGRVLVRQTDAAAATFAVVIGADLSGDLVARGGEVFVDQSEITGSVNSRDSRYTDLYASFVDGDVRVLGTSEGSLMCQTTVQGVGVLRDNTGLVQVGSDGPAYPCAGGSYWGGNVTAAGNTGGVYVNDVIVNGRLSLQQNSPVAQVGAAISVREGIVGDYAEWNDASALERGARGAQQEQSPRVDALQDRIDERKQQAQTDADRAGAADIG